MVIPKVVDHWPQLMAHLNTLVRFSPNFLTSGILSTTLNQVLSTELQQQRLNFLATQWVRIEVPDLNLNFCITLHQQRLRVSLQPQASSVTMRGNSASLLLLISGQVDPDTLFFRRKLLIKGDTELGLEVKNLLDTIELAGRLPKPVYQWTQQLADGILARPELR